MSARFPRGLRRRRAPQGRLVLDDRGVRRLDPRGGETSLAWADLQEVRIVSRPAPTLSEGVRFELRSGTATLLIPRPEATQDFIDRLQELPGFDTEVLIEAIGSTEDGEFLCWSDQAGNACGEED
jgi:hypothetical protein